MKKYIIIRGSNGKLGFSGLTDEGNLLLTGKITEVMLFENEQALRVYASEVLSKAKIHDEEQIEIGTISAPDLQKARDEEKLKFKVDTGLGC